jgi:hypothetical protein
VGRVPEFKPIDMEFIGERVNEREQIIEGHPDTAEG